MQNEQQQQGENSAPIVPEVGQSIPPQPQARLQAQPQSDTQPQPVPSQPQQQSNPGSTLAIIGVIAGFLLTPLIGLIISIVAYKKSKKAGFDNTLAKVFAWIFGIFSVVMTLAVAAVVGLMIFGLSTSRTKGATFLNDIRSGDCNSAANMADLSNYDRESFTSFCEQMKPILGSSQTLVESSVDNSRVVSLYSISGGTKKYVRVTVKNGKVLNAVASDTQLPTTESTTNTTSSGVENTDDLIQ